MSYIKFGFCIFSAVPQKENGYMVLSHDAFTVRVFNNCAIFSPNSSHVTVLKITPTVTFGFVDLLYSG